ncbi:MAG: NAD(P)-binding protein [Gammaproteobacteria bacterium]|nr:NAD(P)-binding protein [Gammaproteobacteria bacterium]
MSSSHKLTTPQSVAVIGGGLAGICCATALSASVTDVTVFEASDEVGGRLRSLVIDGVAADYGAQYFTARSDEFTEQIKIWRDDWLVDEWQGWLVDLHNGQAISHVDNVARYVGRPQMQVMVSALAESCNVRCGVTVDVIKREQQRWSLAAAGIELGKFDAVVLAVPAPQAMALLNVWPEAQQELAAVEIMPCWSLALQFAEPLAVGYDGAYVLESPLAWIARDSSKPERSGADTGPEIWILQASPEWSEMHSHLSQSEVSALLVAAFCQATQISLPALERQRLHYWPYAQTVRPLGAAYLYSPALQLGICGDWCLRGRVEAAFQSADALAKRMLRDDDISDNSLVEG